jgi:hypothetical protein
MAMANSAVGARLHQVWGQRVSGFNGHVITGSAPVIKFGGFRASQGVQTAKE